jgi:hypothetical protein
VFESAYRYRAASAGPDRDLTRRLGPIQPVLDRLDPILMSPRFLRDDDLQNLVAFVRSGLLDPRALPQNLCGLVPTVLPSGMPPLRFEQCPQAGR